MAKVSKQTIEVFMFKSGYTLRLFRLLEDDVIDFVEYIPLEYYSVDERNRIFSPKLTELLIRIGSQIDIFFRNWDIVQDKNSGMALDKLQFGNYKSINIKLEDKEIRIISTNETINPFKNWKRNDPIWWTAYNHAKHNGFYYKEEGNLNNVIDSLSALFLLNCIHEETQIRLIEYGYRRVDRLEYDILIRQKNHMPLNAPYITSKLFETYAIKAFF